MSERAAVRPRLSSEERKASIVRAAMKLFGEKGFRGTTTRELAAAVGVTEPVIYEHYKTKDELYRAIIDHCTSEGAPIIAAVRERYLHSSDDRAFFTELAQLIFCWYTEDPTFIRLLLFSNLENHEMRDLFHQRMKCGFYGFITEYLERRIREGAFRIVDAELVARAFAGMVSNYALTGLVFGNSLPLNNQQVIEGMVDIFMEGIRAKQ